MGSVFFLCGLSVGPGVWHNNCAKLQLLHFSVCSWSRNFPQIELENEAKYSHKTSLQPCGKPHVTQWSYIKIFSPGSSIKTKVICQAVSPLLSGAGARLSFPSTNELGVALNPLPCPGRGCAPLGGTGGVWEAADGQMDRQRNSLFRGSALQATLQLLQPDSHHPQLFPVLPLRRLLRCFCL